MNESVESKAAKLFYSGAVGYVGETDRGEPIRTYDVEGKHDVYTVRVSPFGYSCTCPARSRCSHELAVVLAEAAAGRGLYGKIFNADEGET